MSKASPILSTLFETMDYVASQDPLAVAKAWLQGKSGMKCFVDGKLEMSGTGSEELRDQCTNKVLTTISVPCGDDLKKVFESSLSGVKDWEKLDCHGRGSCLWKIAKKMDQKKALLSDIDALIYGCSSSLRKTDLPGAYQFFHYFALQSHVLQEVCQDTKHGVVVACLVKPSPLIALLAMVAPALAAGNAVLIHTAAEASLPAFVLAEVCAEAGLPPGVLNVIPGPLSTAKDLIKAHAVQVSVWGPKASVKDICCQLTDVGRPIIPFSFGKSCGIIFNLTDISSALSILSRNMCFSDIQLPWSVSTIFVEEAVYQYAAEELKKKLVSFRVGGLCDVGAEVQLPKKCDKEKFAYLNNVLQDFSLRGVEIYKIDIRDDLFYPPTVIVGGEAEINVISKDCEILPFVSVVPFRTPKEAVEMVNKKHYGAAVSVWTDSMPEAVSVASSLEVGTVWINDHGLLDPSVPFTNWKDGGFGCLGGQEGLCQYSFSHLASGESGSPIADKMTSAEVEAAATAAKKAQGQWAKLKPAERSGLMLDVADLFAVNCAELCSSFKSESAARKEVETCGNHLSFWAAQSGKLACARCSNSVGGIVNVLHYPKGIIGIVLEDSSEIESFALNVVQALSFGNGVLVVPNQNNPKLVSKFCDWLNAVKIPSGLVSVLSKVERGDYSKIILNRNVSSIWYSGNDPASLYAVANTAMKSVWCNSYDQESVEFAATQVKSIWLPCEK